MSCDLNNPFPISDEENLGRSFEDEMSSCSEDLSVDVDMPMYAYSPNGTLHPLFTAATTFDAVVAGESDSDDEADDATDSSTEQAERGAGGRTGMVKRARSTGGVSRRGATAGGTVPRWGACRGRVSRAAKRAVLGDSGWRRGEQVLEVCRDDEDVPASLRELVSNTENARSEVARRARSRQNVRMNVADENEDEFQNAESFGPAQELFGGDRGALEFVWSPMSTFSGREEEFQPENPGPNVNVSGPYEAFRVYWDDSILEHIVRETNRYAAELKASSVRFARDWYDTNVHEIMILFAFWMMTGVIQMPSIKSCFSTNRLLQTNIFKTLMTEARFWYLNRALHFVNNATQTPTSSQLFSLGPLVAHLNAKFQEAYTLDQKITIDESLMLWKGNLSFRQYMKRKAARLGIKTFELCESTTSYLWSFIIYSGKDISDGQSQMLKSAKIVSRLMRPLLNKGHQLFLNNWYNSPLLARFLKRNKTDCIGTLRKSRNNVPALIQHVSLKEGTCVARHSGDVVVMAYHDKQTIYTISTCHGTESVKVESRPGRPSHYRPKVIADYNFSMGGVEKRDQMLEPYLFERKKTRKWYKKMFKRLLNVSIFNSRILLDKSIPDPVKQQAFRLRLVDEIIDRHLQSVPNPVTRSSTIRFTGLLPAGRLVNVGHHFLARISIDGPRTGPTGISVGRKYCLRCTVVEKRQKRTVYECDSCKVPLCLEECFKRFHTE